MCWSTPENRVGYYQKIAIHVELYLLWHIPVTPGKIFEYIFVEIVFVCFAKREYVFYF